MFEYDLPYYFAGLPFTRRQVPRKLAWLLARGEIRQVIRGVYVDVRVKDSLELARHLDRPFALSAVDALLHAPAVMPDQLRDASTTYFYEDGNTQAHQILRYADRRAASPAESWLRLRLIDAGFGVPDLQVRVDGPARVYRLDLGYPDRPVDGRRLGLEYDSDQWHSGPKAEARDESRRTELEALGWHIIPVRRTDLWGSYPALELAVGGFLCQHPRLPRRW